LATISFIFSGFQGSFHLEAVWIVAALTRSDCEWILGKDLKYSFFKTAESVTELRKSFHFFLELFLFLRSKHRSEFHLRNILQ
jgi:hypothetical protein